MQMNCDQHRAILFHKQLEMSTGMKLNLKINDNRSTMLRVRWEANCTKVSLHRMFLKAPKNIMDELACYLNREHKKLTPAIKAYIEDHVQKLDYSHELDLSLLETKGRVYDLAKMYRAINREYFDGNLQLHITWYGEKWKRGRTRITFGLYNDPLRLIKIHRLLDDKAIPAFVVAYVIYHEILHHVCPPHVDKNGLKHIHSKAFKIREREFEFFLQAQQWIKENQKALFDECYYGRS